MYPQYCVSSIGGMLHCYRLLGGMTVMRMRLEMEAY